MKIKTIMDIASCRMNISKEINDNALASTGEKGTFTQCWWECKTKPAFLKYFPSHSFSQNTVLFRRTWCWQLFPFSTMKLSDSCLTCNIVKRNYLLQMQFAVILSSFIKTCFNEFIKFISIHSLQSETKFTVALVFKYVLSCDHSHPLLSLAWAGFLPLLK